MLKASSCPTFYCSIYSLTANYPYSSLTAELLIQWTFTKRNLHKWKHLLNEAVEKKSNWFSIKSVLSSARHLEHQFASNTDKQNWNWASCWYRYCRYPESNPIQYVVTPCTWTPFGALCVRPVLVCRFWHAWLFVCNMEETTKKGPHKALSSYAKMKVRADMKCG